MANIISVTLKLKDSDFARSLDTQRGKLATFGSGFAKVGVGVLKAGAVIGAGLGAATLATIPLINAASDLSEEQSKAGAVFGKASGEMLAFAKTADEASGLSQVAALGLGNRFGQLLKQVPGLENMGGSVSGVSQDLLGLSGDLASFNNLEVDDVAQKLIAGLSGESEPLKAMGIFINDAAVQAKALELGLKGVNNPLTDQEKIWARYQLIMEASTDAQGDFARTSDGLANKQRILAARFENVKSTLGARLLPVALKVADAFLSGFDAVVPVIDRLFAVFDQGGFSGLLKEVVAFGVGLWPTLQTGLVALLAGIGGFIVEMAPVVAEKLQVWGAMFVAWAADAIPPLMEKLNGLIASLTQWVGDNLGVISEKLIGWAQAFIEWVAPMIPPLLAELALLAVAIVTWMVTELTPQLATALFDLGSQFTPWLLGGIGDVVSSLWQKGWDFMTGLFDGLKLGWLLPFAWLVGLPGLAFAAIIGAGFALWQHGADLMGGLWDGLIAIWEKVAAWLGGLKDQVVSAFKSAITGAIESVPGGGLVLDVTGGAAGLAGSGLGALGIGGGGGGMKQSNTTYNITEAANPQAVAREVNDFNNWHGSYARGDGN